jgi:hypothetical protein
MHFLHFYWHPVWSKKFKIHPTKLQLKFFRNYNWSGYRVASGVLVGLQLNSLKTCNWSAFCRVATECCWVTIRLIKIIKNYMYIVATEMLEELQLKCLPCCNWSAVWVAIRLTKIIKITCLELQLKCLRSCNWVAYRVATGVLVELQLKCLRSCNWSACWVATVLTLQLQPDSGSSCNQCTLRVANTDWFRLILYYSFRCNPIVVRVAIDIHYELQILSAPAWFCNQ